MQNLDRGTGTTEFELAGRASVAVESSESSRVGNSDVTRSNELHRVVTRELNEL